MRRGYLLFTLFAALLLVAGTAATASAEHDDVIPEVIPDSDINVGLEPIADGFTQPVWAVSPPGITNRIYVVDQIGKITAVPTSGSSQRTLFLDVGVDGLDLLVPLGAFGPGSFDERGLLGLAFHPNYRQNGLIYTYTSEPAMGNADFSTMPAGVDANHQATVREWHVPGPRSARATVDPSSSRVLLTVDEPQFNHNAGALAFGRDGMLYIALGDGGNADDQGDGHAPGGNGQDLSDGNVLGKILRIDPSGANSANGNYGIPATNPFVGKQGADEIYAYGFRNPFRMSFDTATGRLIAADVGQNDIEEVDVVRRGGNYGWPVKEGSFLFDMNGDGEGFTTAFSPGVPAGMIDPVAEYDHDEGVSITGGFVYRGSAISDLRGSYVFGDFTRSFAGPEGRVFAFTPRSGIAELLEPGLFIGGFGQDGAGELYVLGSQVFTPTGETGVVMKLVAGG
jgi:glucose/arabinose dehydrogenase